MTTPVVRRAQASSLTSAAGGDEVCGGQALVEALVGPGQQVPRLLVPALVAPEAGEAGRGAQFPRQRALGPRHLERAQEDRFRRGHGVRRVAQSRSRRRRAGFPARAPADPALVDALEAQR